MIDARTRAFPVDLQHVLHHAPADHCGRLDAAPAAQARGVESRLLLNHDKRRPKANSRATNSASQHGSPRELKSF